MRSARPFSLCRLSFRAADQEKGTAIGAWGYRPFENDRTNDWAYGLDGVADLSLVETAFARVEGCAEGYLDEATACDALGACEVLARLMGHPGYTSAYTAKVDRWVATRRLEPPPALLQRAAAVLDRILGTGSELRDEWDAGGQGAAWRQAVEDLRQRMRT